MKEINIDYEGIMLHIEYYYEQDYIGRKHVAIEDIFDIMNKSIMDNYTELEHDGICDIIEDINHDYEIELKLEKEDRRRHK